MNELTTECMNYQMFDRMDKLFDNSTEWLID